MRNKSASKDSERRANNATGAGHNHDNKRTKTKQSRKRKHMDSDLDSNSDGEQAHNVRVFAAKKKHRITKDRNGGLHTAISQALRESDTDSQ